MLFSPLYFRNALKYLGIISLSLILLFISTKYATFNSRSIVKNIGGRILYGEISELPYYFEIFSNEKVNIKSLMPPYLVGKQKPAARIVAEYSVDKKFSALPGGDTGEKALYARVAGVANTFFTGEAFAWAGYPGVILSPFIMMAHLAFYIYLFERIKKTWFTVYVFSFLLYKVFIGIFGGISYFIFSSMHIILIAFLMLLVSWRYLESKNIPFFNRIAKNYVFCKKSYIELISMGELPFTSIIIPCRNEERFIGNCLDSIIANDYPKERLEVLAVDGMSEDGTRDCHYKLCPTVSVD